MPFAIRSITMPNALVLRVTPETRWSPVSPVSYPYIIVRSYAHNAMHNIHSCTFTVAPIVVPGIDPGCSDDTECPVHKACINNICRDPCIVEDPCARNAFCKVNLHEPECTCPPGFTGDPRVLCVARKFTQIICLIHYRTLQNSRG